MSYLIIILQNSNSDGSTLLLTERTGCTDTDHLSLPLQLESELEQCERESAELQEYANSVLQQIADHCPDILEQVVNALEESC